MTRWMVILCTVCGVAFLAGCASSKDFEALQKTVSDVRVKVTELSKQVADMEARLKTTEEQAAQASLQAKAVGADMDNVKNELKKVSSTVIKAHELFMMSLENMRDIYKRQYDALSEILDKEVSKPAPAAK